MNKKEGKEMATLQTKMSGAAFRKIGEYRNQGKLGVSSECDPHSIQHSYIPHTTSPPMHSLVQEHHIHSLYKEQIKSVVLTTTH